jgi:hypothetical protein
MKRQQPQDIDNPQRVFSRGQKLVLGFRDFFCPETKLNGNSFVYTQEDL